MNDLKERFEKLFDENPFRPSYMVVVEILREEISACRLQSGDHLKEIETARKMGVSRSTIRHAFDVLILDGSVIKRESYGVEVAPMRQHRYLEIMELRIMLDAFSARLASAKRKESDLDRMKSQIAKLLEAKDAEELANADIGFHYAIYQAADNSSLLRIYNDFNLDVIRSRYMTVQAIFQIRDRVASEHMAIYEAIRQQNPQKAFTAAMSHANILYDPLLISQAFK